MLTAAFFATEKDLHEKEDGIIYALSPNIINAEFGEYTSLKLFVLDNMNDCSTFTIGNSRFNLLGQQGRKNAVACARDNRLTEEEVRNLLLQISRAELKQLINGAFGQETIDDKIMAVVPHQQTRRIMQQQGVFTIHSRRSNLFNNVTQHTDRLIRQITIPVDSKRDIREELRLLGVTRSQLFPDLDNLAREISEPREC